MISIAKAWLDDLRCAVAFLTRVPMPHPDGAVPPNFARAHRAFPLIGAGIGAVIGTVYLTLAAIGMPRVAAAAVALGAGVVLTGALHEDGLADVADGFRQPRQNGAQIMLSRHGTYGALVLLVTFVAKVSALAALPGAAVLPGLIAAHALARAPLTVMAMTMPNARHEGLAATAGTPDALTAASAAILAIVIAFAVLPWTDAILAALAAAASALCVALLAYRQIGGKTGDVMGGAEQIAETAILLLLAARL